MKALRTWTIITLVFAVLCLGLVAVCLYRPVAFGDWMVLTYEDITCELGHTAEGAYRILTSVSIISFSALFLINQILHFCYSSKAKKQGSSEKKTDVKIIKEETAVLKRVKSEKKERKKKERREKIKRVSKKAIDVVTEKVTETRVGPPARENSSDNEKLASFLNSFR